MKKVLFLLPVLATVTFSLTSCGPTAMSEEDKAKKVAELVDAKKGDIEKAADADCTAKSPAMVAALTDSIVKAAKPAAPEAPAKDTKEPAAPKAPTKKGK